MRTTQVNDYKPVVSTKCNSVSKATCQRNVLSANWLSVKQFVSELTCQQTNTVIEIAFE